MLSIQRCAHCGNADASYRITVAVGVNPPEATPVCSGCIEKVERQALGSVNALLPHAIVSRRLDQTNETTFHCPDCGYDLENLVRTGKLGCRNCYETFRDEIVQLLRRSVGRETHRGKYPPPQFQPPGSSA